MPQRDLVESLMRARAAQEADQAANPRGAHRPRGGTRDIGAAVKRDPGGYIRSHEYGHIPDVAAGEQANSQAAYYLDQLAGLQPPERLRRAADTETRRMEHQDLGPSIRRRRNAPDTGPASGGLEQFQDTRPRKPRARSSSSRSSKGGGQGGHDADDERGASGFRHGVSPDNFDNASEAEQIALENRGGRYLGDQMQADHGRAEYNNPSIGLKDGVDYDGTDYDPMSSQPYYPGNDPMNPDEPAWKNPQGKRDRGMGGPVADYPNGDGNAPVMRQPTDPMKGMERPPLSETGGPDPGSSGAERYIAQGIEQAPNWNGPSDNEINKVIQNFHTSGGALDQHDVSVMDWLQEEGLEPNDPRTDVITEIINAIGKQGPGASDEEQLNAIANKMGR